MKAEGTVSDSQTALWTPTEKCRVQSVRFHSNTNTQTLRVYVRKEGKTARRVYTANLNSDESCIPIGEIDWEKGDSIEAVSSTNGAVDYTVNFVPLKDAQYLVHGGFRPSKYNAQGAEVIIASSSAGTGVGTTGYIAAGTSTDSLGTVFFVDSNSISFGLSNGSLTAKFSVTNTFSQTVQTQHIHDVTLAGNSTSAGAGYILISSGTMTLAGGANVTLSQNGNAVTIIGGAGASAGIAGLQNSQTLYTAGTVFLSGLNAVTVRSSAGQVYAFDVPFQSTETAKYALDGTGNSIVGLGTVSTVNVNSIGFRAVGGISIGFDLNDVIEFSVGTGGGGGGGASESIGMSNLGNTSGTTGIASADGFRYVFAGGNNITLSQSLDAGRKSGTLTISAVSFANSNGLTLSVSAGTVTGSYTVPVVGNQIQQVQSFTGSGTNTSKFAADDHVHAGIYSVGVHSIGNTAGNTGLNPGQYVFAGSNAVTLSQDTGTAAVGLQTIWVQGPASATTISGVTSANVIGTRGSRFALEDHQHVGVYSIGVSNVGNTSGNTGGLPGQAIFAGGNNITLSVGTAAGSLQTVTISAVSFVNSNGVTFGLNAGSLTASFSNNVVGNAIQDVGSATGSGTNTSRFAADDHVHRGVFQVQISGNTSNTSNAVFGSVVLAGGNNLTLSQVSAAGAATVTFSNYHVIAGTQSLSSASALSFADSNGIVFGMSGSSRITANAGFLSYWANQDGIGATVTTTHAQSTSMISPFFMPLPISASYLRLLVMNSAQTTTIGTTANTTITMSHLQTIYAMVYAQGTGASSRSLMSVTSSSGASTQVFKVQMNANGSQATQAYSITYLQEGVTSSFSASAGQSAATQTLQSSIASDFNGARYLDIPFANSLSAGNYWFAYGLSSTTSTQGSNALTNMAFNHGIIANSNQQLTGVGTLGFGNMAAATNSSNDYFVGLGSYTSNAIGPVAALNISIISSNQKRINPFLQFVRQA